MSRSRSGPGLVRVRKVKVGLGPAQRTRTQRPGPELYHIFGTDRSPRRGDLVCASVRVCVCVSLSSKEHGKGVLESLRRGPDASKQASKQESKQESKQARKQGSRQASKQASK